MLKLLSSFAIIMAIATNVNCQNLQAADTSIDQHDSVVADADRIVANYEQAPEFRGGMKEFTKHIMQHLDVSALIKKGAPAGIYHVMVRFTVAKNGKTHDFEPITNNGYGMEEQVIDIIKSARKKWKPALKNGLAVNVYQYQNITYSIDN